ncbi:MAG: type 1 glutamine amidotransferase [Thermoanaerobaculia bacterium]|nr:type 1 glutamine amidotransferase [Thermoanaerobaculia bacterium]
MPASGDLARLRLLLLQIRDEPEVEQQEQDCFVHFSGLAAEQFAFRNLVERPDLAPQDVRGFDAVVIGGAGAHSVTEEYPFTAPLAAAVETMVAARQPLFGSCWGHQFIAKALGGAVITDLPRKELGTFEIALTPAGEADPWLSGLPRRFGVQLGHHDRVVTLPPGGVELAASELCPNQAFRLEAAPVYGAQFHVELDRERMLERASVYRDEYLADHGAMESLEQALLPSPESATLLRRFLSRVVAAGGV